MISYTVHLRVPEDSAEAVFNELTSDAGYAHVDRSFISAVTQPGTQIMSREDLLLGLLDDIRERVAIGDSMEGYVSWQIADPDEYPVEYVPEQSLWRRGPVSHREPTGSGWYAADRDKDSVMSLTEGDKQYFFGAASAIASGPENMIVVVQFKSEADADDVYASLAMIFEDPMVARMAVRPIVDRRIWESPDVKPS